MERIVGAAVASVLGLIVWTVLMYGSQWVLKRYWPRGYEVLFRVRHIRIRRAKKPAAVASEDSRRV